MKYVLLIAAMAAAEVATACATCSGPADAPQSLGMNAAILTLLGTLAGVVLTGLAFISLVAWRIARHEAAVPEGAANNTLAGAEP